MSYVLIVEDDVNVAEAISDMVGQFDWETKIVHDPRAAIQAFHQQSPALILLDLNIPGINGMEVLRYVKRDPVAGDTAVVFVTIEDNPTIMEEALEAGAMDYLVKPIDAKRIEGILDKLRPKE